MKSRHLSVCVCTLWCLLLLVGSTPALAQGLPDGVENTQDPKDIPTPPQEALKKITVPEGFKVTLFAAEPQVHQPIGMAIDDRGRLWVAECYSYKEWQTEEQGADRILIFEDKDNDGEYDTRKVFMDGLNNLSSIEIGFGGVWALCAPHLLFIPDANEDDKPDKPPLVKLEGWTLNARHNIVNGLTWGPDGWLYGCHGIVDESKVGVPGSPVEDRPPINCGIWRYHPKSELYEPVCHGTTNPWGLDFDEYGEAFFVNCVIGHLWHMIPGAHYKRMYGKDYMPHSYELIDSHSNHLHWGGGDWRLSRTGEGVHNTAGGGHAHCGLMIYYGDSWPDSYRGKVYMNNIHGYRLNVDILKPEGSGYEAEHGKDFFFANDKWFRGVALKYGPDGGVYVLDWTDLGECHDNDGVHRSSGRIYKIAYGEPRKLPALQINTATNEQLLDWLSHKNKWYVRHAQRVLQERATGGQDLSEVQTTLEDWFLNSKTSPERLQAFWTLYVIGALDEADLIDLLEHEDEHVRAWSVRLLSDDGELSQDARSRLATMAPGEPSAKVRLNLASALQRMPAADRVPLAAGLLSHEEDVEDHNLPLMIWYGIEPTVAADKTAAVKLLTVTKIPLVRQFIAKRLAEAAP